MARSTARYASTLFLIIGYLILGAIGPGSVSSVTPRYGSARLALRPHATNQSTHTWHSAGRRHIAPGQRVGLEIASRLYTEFSRDSDARPLVQEDSFILPAPSGRSDHRPRDPPLS